MELRRKLAVLADAAKYDASCASSGTKRAPASLRGSSADASKGMGICHAYTPDGRCVSLLKVLLTNVCIYDCQYCVNRLSSDTERATFTPRELVDLTLEFYRRNYIEGLFLSSGVMKSPDATMERMVEVARCLRQDHRFAGYIHLKIIPNASADLLRRAGRFADRLSANVELPTAGDLARLAPDKSLADVDRSMTVIGAGVEEASQARRGRASVPLFAPAGQSTQMIVGATPTADAQILATASGLYTQHKLRRVYYAAYSPIPGADPRLPSQAIGSVREHRLYQADWLVRFYGYAHGELLAPGENLDALLDPKTVWALRNRARFPVDIARADREWLLRVPGLGVRSVERILVARRHGPLRLDDLARLGVALARARHFIVTADHNAALRQLDSVELRQQLTHGRREAQLALPL